MEGKRFHNFMVKLSCILLSLVEDFAEILIFSSKTFLCGAKLRRLPPNYVCHVLS